MPADTTETPAPAAALDAGETASVSDLTLDELGPAEAALLASWKKGGESTEDPEITTPAGAGALAAEAAEEAAPTTDEGSEEAAADGDPDEAEGEEPEAEAEEPEEADDAGKKSPVQRRIDALVAKRNELTAENARLKGELEAARGRSAGPLALVPLPEDPLADVTSEAEIETRLAKAREIIAWTKKNRSGAQVPAGPGSAELVEMTAEQIEAIRDEQEDILREHGPARREWLRTYQSSHEAARKAYPDLFTPGTSDAAFVRAVIAQVPGFARSPLHELQIGDMLIGAQVRTGKLKVVKPSAPAAAAGKPAAAPPPRAPRAAISSAASAPTPRRPGNRPDASDYLTRAAKGEMSSDEAVEAMLAEKFG